MNKNLEIIEKELKHNKIAKKYKSDFSNQKYLLLFSLMLYLTILILFLVYIFIADNKFVEIVLLSDASIICFSLFIPFLFFITIFISLKIKKISRHCKKLEKINWLQLFTVHNNYNFIISKLKLELFCIDKKKITQLIVDRSINKIIINNNILISINNINININYLELTISEDELYLQLIHEITFSKKMHSTEIKKILQGINNIILVENSDSSTRIKTCTNLILKQKMIKYSKDYLIKTFNPNNFSFSEYIFGLYAQNNYNRDQYLNYYKESILNDIEKIYNLLKKNED
ncbi:hypothetical protein [Spiroplasma endosymbiont of Cantharis rufa]|uniref:hypothetical protein n=1 Tax=Spiroplasma endosymbiont of Cantharis rufa TaxID=3066279 RepID=UPI0030D002C6